MAFISVTRLRVMKLRFLPEFFIRSIAATSQARKAEGNLGVDLLRDADRAFWTLSVWESAEAMRAYMKSGEHAKAMPKLIEWCDEAAVANWQSEKTGLPAWSEAYDRLLKDGRASKIRHPSPRHADLSYPPPRAT